MALEWMKNNQNKLENCTEIWFFTHCQSKNMNSGLCFSYLSFFHFSTFFNDSFFYFFVYVLAKRGKNWIWICTDQYCMINQIQTVCSQTETGTSVKCNKIMLSNSSDGSDSSVLLLPLSFDLFFWFFFSLACILFVLFFFLFIALTAASFHHKIESPPHYAWSFAF